MRNIHERVIEAPSETMAPLLATLGQPNDQLWPRDWVPLRLDGPLGVGADGGHGPIRYHVTAYEPGKRVEFTFHPRTGITGMHEFTVEALSPGSCRLRHVLEATPKGIMRIALPLFVRSLHDAVLEDLLDNAQRHAEGTVSNPARWSWWVKLWRFLTREKSESRAGFEERKPTSPNADLVFQHIGVDELLH